MSNNNGSRYLIESREQKRKLSPLYKEWMFSLWFGNAFSYLESAGVLTRTHSRSGFWAGGGRDHFPLVRSWAGKLVLSF